MPFDFVFAMQHWSEVLWVSVGFLGQGIFGGRMLLQWLASERVRKSVVPVEFWYMSVIGATITLAYAIWRQDPVFMVAQAGGLLVYARNLYFISIADSGEDDAGEDDLLDFGEPLGSAELDAQLQRSALAADARRSETPSGETLPADPPPLPTRSPGANP